MTCVTVLAASLLGCRQSESRAESTPPPIEIKAALFPARSSTVVAQIDGQVQNIGVQEGAAIAANAVVVDLSNAAVERDAAVAKAQLDWIAARERSGGQAPAPVRRNNAPQDRVQVAERILALKQQRLEKMKELRATNDVTGREVEIAEVEYLAALRDYNEERRAASGVASVIAAPAGDRELLRIERQKTEAEAKFASQRLALLHMSAPIAGTVTRVFVSPGQAVFPRDPIAEISDLSTLQVRGTVAPELIRFLRPGMRVQVRVYSVPPRTFSDEIEYITPGQGEARGATVVVLIPNPDRSLLPNTEASITLGNPGP